MPKLKLEPTENSELTDAQLAALQQFVRMLKHAAQDDSIAADVKKLTAKLEKEGRSELLADLLPIGQLPRYRINLRNALLVDWLDRGMDKRLVMRIAVDAGMFDRKDRNLVRNFNARIVETRAELADADVTLAELTDSAYKSAAMLDRLDRSITEYRAALLAEPDLDFDSFVSRIRRRDEDVPLDLN